MFGFDPYYVGGTFFGSIIGVWLFSNLYRYALLGRSGTKLQQICVVLLTGIVAIGFSAFADGTDGFVNRITNPSDIVKTFSYSLSALLIASLVWWRAEEKPNSHEKETKGSTYKRAIALLFVVPMILIGLGNIGGSIYSLAVNGSPPGSGLGVSRAEMRNIMLSGDMAPFWQVVSERAPQDMDYIINRIFDQEDEMQNAERARQIFNQELVKYRVSLATYASALNDQQRKDIIQTTLDMVRAFEDRPALCLDLLMTGGQNLTQEQLFSSRNLWNQNMIVVTESLFDARQVAAGGTLVPKPPTEQDYGALVQLLYERGVPEEQLQALFNEDTSHPQFCQAQIAFLDALLDLEGQSGEAVRSEVSQAMLVAGQ